MIGQDVLLVEREKLKDVDFIEKLWKKTTLKRVVTETKIIMN